MKATSSSVVGASVFAPSRAFGRSNPKRSQRTALTPSNSAITYRVAGAFFRSSTNTEGSLSVSCASERAARTLPMVTRNRS
jgi:hypothetical protein